MWDMIGLVCVIFCICFTTIALLVAIGIWVWDKRSATQNIVYRGRSFTISKRIPIAYIKRMMVEYYPELETARFIRRRGRVHILPEEVSRESR